MSGAHLHIADQFAGAGNFSGKLDALLWALRLETPCLDFYCRNIVALVSDQGVLVWRRGGAAIRPWNPIYIQLLPGNYLCKHIGISVTFSLCSPSLHIELANIMELQVQESFHIPIQVIILVPSRHGRGRGPWHYGNATNYNNGLRPGFLTTII